MIVHSKQAIFIHIQKTAGHSINRVLGRYTTDEPFVRHEIALKARRRYGRETFDRYFKFCVVRNPWDKMVSLYSDLRQRLLPKAGVAFDLSFRQWLLRLDSDPLYGCDRINYSLPGYPFSSTTENQLNWITDARGRILVDFVARFERLADDWLDIRRRLGIDDEIPHINRSRHEPYRTYYCDATRDVVARRYARDIEAFGYEF